MSYINLNWKIMEAAKQKNFKQKNLGEIRKCY